MNRTEQCLREQGRAQVLGCQVCLRSSAGQGCVGQGFAPFLSQMRTVESLMMMETRQLRHSVLGGLQDTGGCALPPASSAICSPQRDSLILSYLRAKEVGTSEVTLILHNSAPKKDLFQGKMAATSQAPLYSDSGLDEENGSQRFILMMPLGSSNCVVLACVLGVVLSAEDMQMSTYRRASGLWGTQAGRADRYTQNVEHMRLVCHVPVWLDKL